ncbi:MAG: HDIG domain-containing metalloprotein [Pseudomonadota bacterium]
MQRDDALSLLHAHVKNERMRRHCLASEAVLRALAARTGHDVERWGVAGLLHDLDVEDTAADPHRHGMEARPLLEPLGLDEELIDAIERHNEEACPRPRETALHHLLAAGETVTGLIMATAMVYPDKKLASVKPKSVLKRMKEKAFAAGVNRDIIRECEQAQLPLDELVSIALEAMREISDPLGL